MAMLDYLGNYVELGAISSRVKLSCIWIAERGLKLH